MNQESLDDLMILTFYSLVCWYLYLAFSPKRFALGMKVIGIWRRITNQEPIPRGRRVATLDITLWILIILLLLIYYAGCFLLCWILYLVLSSTWCTLVRKINGIWQELIPQGIRGMKIIGIWRRITNQEPIPHGRRVKVNRVPDGDGVYAFDLKTGEAFEVHLIGIDAPEMRGQAFSKEAKNYLSKLVLGKFVTLITYNEDQYGRTLGSIYIGGEKDCVSIMMLKKGLAHIYTGRNAEYGGEKKAFIAAEHYARNLRLGVWSSSSTQHPADFKRALRNGCQPLPVKKNYFMRFFSRVI